MLKTLPILAVSAVAIACGGSAAAAAHDVTGSIAVSQYMGTRGLGTECTGQGGYDDIHAGSAVVVKDEGGKILATSQLDPGKITRLGECTFAFSVRSVPDAKFYQFEVSHRGQVTYAKKDLSDAGWTVKLTLS